MSFPRLNSDAQNFIPAYTQQLSHLQSIGTNVSPNSIWQAPERSWCFLGFSVINLPVWWLENEEYRSEWVRHNSTLQTYLQDEAEERSFALPHLFRVYWYSDGRFLTTSAMASALWWFLLSFIAPAFGYRRSAVA